MATANIELYVLSQLSTKRGRKEITFSHKYQKKKNRNILAPESPSLTTLQTSSSLRCGNIGDNTLNDFEKLLLGSNQQNFWLWEITIWASITQTEIWEITLT